MTEERQAHVPPAGDDRVRAQDTGVWRLATWFLPIAVQVVLAVTAGVTWLLSKGPLAGRDAFGALVLTGAIITAAMSLVLARYVWRSAGSPRRRALGLTIAGAGVAVLIVAVVYALALMPLLEVGD